MLKLIKDLKSTATISKIVNILFNENQPETSERIYYVKIEKNGCWRLIITVPGTWMLTKNSHKYVK